MGFAAVGVVLAIMVYLTLYLPHVRHIDTDWNEYDPRMIPTATAAGVVAVLWCVCGVACCARCVCAPSSPHPLTHIHPCAASSLACGPCTASSRPRSSPCCSWAASWCCTSSPTAKGLCARRPLLVVSVCCCCSCSAAAGCPVPTAASVQARSSSSRRMAVLVLTCPPERDAEAHLSCHASDRYATPRVSAALPVHTLSCRTQNALTSGSEGERGEKSSSHVTSRTACVHSILAAARGAATILGGTLGPCVVLVHTCHFPTACRSRSCERSLGVWP